MSGDKRVFVTSSLYQGGLLGGLTGADGRCAERATAAGLSGTYKAWLSTPTVSARDRLTHSTGGYYLVDGTMIGANWDDLLHGLLMHEIDRNELGNVHVAEPSFMAMLAAWSATDFDGTYEPVAAWGTTCGAWDDLHESGALGNVNRLDTAWTDSGASTMCTEQAALYCFEQ